jgi:triacylglycerol esterase/lipase EstA (alpha/beta hydrolase family)
MTTKEQQTIDSLYKLVQDLKSENIKFREDIKYQVDGINNKTDKKHLPIYYEQDILKSCQSAIQETIGKVLIGYDSPLTKLVKSVVDENSTELRKIISDSFSQVIRTDDFKESIVKAFSHKIAKTIISNNDGLFDKVSNELKQDSIFKSKMALAVSNVVEECLNK